MRLVGEYVGITTCSNVSGKCGEDVLPKVTKPHVGYPHCGVCPVAIFNVNLLLTQFNDPTYSGACWALCWSCWASHWPHLLCVMGRHHCFWSNILSNTNCLKAKWRRRQRKDEMNEERWKECSEVSEWDNILGHSTRVPNSMCCWDSGVALRCWESLNVETLHAQQHVLFGTRAEWPGIISHSETSECSFLSISSSSCATTSILCLTCHLWYITKIK